MVRFSRFAALLCLGATAVSLLARHWWLADLIANLRIQLILGLMLATMGLVATHQSRLAALVVIGII